MGYRWEAAPGGRRAFLNAMYRQIGEAGQNGSQATPVQFRRGKQLNEQILRSGELLQNH